MHCTGCNYDYQLIWSDTPCNACGDSRSNESAASWLVEWGYSKYREQTSSTSYEPECLASTELAYTRCCADSCDATAAIASFLAAYNTANADATDDSCMETASSSGTWPRTTVGQTATIPCPGGTDTRSMVRLCGGDGSGWVHESLVDSSNCLAPDTCAVCSCHHCGASGCGASVGAATGDSEQEYLVDCSVRQLQVAPTGFPANATKLNIAGNLWLKTWPSSMLSDGNRSLLKTVYAQVFS